MYRADRRRSCQRARHQRTARTPSAPPRSRRPARSPAGRRCWSAYGTRPLHRGARARDPPRRARLHGHALSARVHRRLRRGSRARSGSRRAVPARRTPRSRPARALVQADYAATLRRIADDGPAALHGGALGTARRRLTSARMAAADRWPISPPTSRRARADPRHLSRLRDRRPAAARLDRRAHRPDAQHPRRLRHRRAWASARPTRSICWPRC